MNSIKAIEPVSSSTRSQTIASLEAQVVRFAQMAASASATANADYRALQSAVKSGDVMAAATALDRLERDQETANASPANAGTLPAAETPSALPNSIAILDGSPPGSFSSVA